MNEAERLKGDILKALIDTHGIRHVSPEVFEVPRKDLDFNDVAKLKGGIMRLLKFNSGGSYADDIQVTSVLNLGDTIRFFHERYYGWELWRGENTIIYNTNGRKTT